MASEQFNAKMTVLLVVAVLALLVEDLAVVLVIVAVVAKDDFVDVPELLLDEARVAVVEVNVGGSVNSADDETAIGRDVVTGSHVDPSVLKIYPELQLQTLLPGPSNMQT